MGEAIKNPLERESTIVFEDIECRPGPELPIADLGKPLAGRALPLSPAAPCTCNQDVLADIALLDKMMRTYTSQAGLFAPRESLLKQLRSNCQLWSDELLRLVDNDGSGTISVKDFSDADSNWILFDPDQVIAFYQEYFFAAPQEFAGADDFVELLKMTSPTARSYLTTTTEQKARQQRLLALQQRQPPGTNTKPSLEALAEIAKAEVDAGRAQSESAVKQREFVKFSLETVLGSSYLKLEDRLKIVTGCIQYGGDLFTGPDRELVVNGLDFLAESSQEGASLESRCLALNSLETLVGACRLAWFTETAYEAMRQSIVVVGADSRHVPDIIRLHYLGTYALHEADRIENLQTTFDIIASLVRRSSPGKTSFGKPLGMEKLISSYGLGADAWELASVSNQFVQFFNDPEYFDGWSASLGHDVLSEESRDELPDTIIALFYLLGMDPTVASWRRSSCADSLKAISLKDDDAERSARAMKCHDDILLSILKQDKNFYAMGSLSQELVDRGVESDEAVSALFAKATRLDNLGLVEDYYGEDGKKEYMERLIKGGYATEVDFETGESETLGMQGLLERYAEEFPEGDDDLIEFLSSEEMLDGNRYSPRNLSEVAAFLDATYDDAETADLVEEYQERAATAQVRYDLDD